MPLPSAAPPRTAANPKIVAHRSRANPAGLSVSAFDRVASLLVALLVMVGVFVLMLFILWLTSRVWVRQEDIPVEFIEPLPAGGTMGEGRDLEEPGEEEVEDLMEPQLEETLDAVTEAISTQRATLESLEGEARSSAKGSGGGGSPGAGGGRPTSFRMGTVGYPLLHDHARRLRETARQLWHRAGRRGWRQSPHRVRIPFLQATSRPADRQGGGRGPNLHDLAAGTAQGRRPGAAGPRWHRDDRQNTGAVLSPPNREPARQDRT